MRRQIIKYCILSFIAEVAITLVNAQVVVSPVVCKNESFAVENQSTTTHESYWDFCEGDLSLTPSAVEISSVELNIPVGTALIQADGKWYGFICSLNTNSLIRIDFGASILNKSPAIKNMGNVGGLLDSPQDIEVVEYNGNFFAFVYNRSGNKLIRIDLGEDAENTTPAVSVLLPGDGFVNGGIDAVFDGADWFVITSNETDLTIVKLGDSPANTPSSESVLTSSSISAIASIADVKLVHDGGEWYAFVVGSSSRTLHRLHFLNGLFSDPVSEQIMSFDYSPYGVALEKDNGRWLMLIATLQGNLLRLDFAASITGQPEFANLGNLGMLNNLLKIDIANSLSRWVALTANWNSQSYYVIEFPQANCPFDKEYATINDDVLKANTNGLFHISLYERLENGLQIAHQEEVEVEDTNAPVVDISATSICEDAAGIFSLKSDQPLSSVRWDFGAYGIFFEQEVQMEFASPGIYLVQLQVVSENGCHNLIENNVKIYPSVAGSAVFNLPPGLVCTRNETTIINVTPDIYDGNLQYQWYINDQPVGTQRDLHYTFNSTGAKEVRLQTSIPGCADEVTKTIPSVEAGPAVDFSFSGVCEDDVFSFQSQVSEPVDSYHWNFNNGEISSDPDPDQSFADGGEYLVSLSATNEIGCQTTKTKPVLVHSRPIVDFSADGMSNACTDQNTFFENQTTNPDGRSIGEWLWTFDDPIDPTPSNAEMGQHLYGAPGTYNVSLIASTAAGCGGTLQKAITIRPSPSTDFTSSSTCEDVPVTFGRPVGDDIASVYWEIGTSYYDDDSPTHVFNSPGDYSFYLEVSGTNGCQATLSKTIHVPEKLSPVFSVIKSCIDQEAVFTDLTTGQDPIVSRQWNFGNGELFSGSPVSYTFTKQDSRTITLQVTTIAGCSYELSKTVVIGVGPTANFSALPSSGAYPLEVSFANTSAMATHYAWQFSGINATSTEQSPVVLFPDQGTFEVKLTAFNSEECEDSFIGTVTTIKPAPDAEIELINVIRNPDGSAKLIVTIHNRGNTIIKDMPVKLDLDGKLQLQQAVEGPVLPSTKYNFVLNTAVLNIHTLRYLCVLIDLPNDIAQEGNRKCLEFEPGLMVFPAYPNPASQTLNIEWISQVNANIRISLIDQIGRSIFKADQETVAGLNKLRLDIKDLNNGQYILRIDDGAAETHQRIMVINRP